MKHTNEIERDWYEYLRANPHEVIDMLAALLAVSGIERIPDEEETSTHGNESNTKQESRDPQAAEEGNQDAEQD